MFPYTYVYEEVLGRMVGVKSEEVGNSTTPSLIFSPLFTLVFIQFPFSLCSNVAPLCVGIC